MHKDSIKGHFREIFVPLSHIKVLFSSIFVYSSPLMLSSVALIREAKQDLRALPMAYVIFFM